MQHDDLPRRSFFVRAVTFVIGSLVGLLPASIAGVFLASPLLRRQTDDSGSAAQDKSADGGFVDLGIAITALPEDGRPFRVAVESERVDAWNVYVAQRIGSVWLRRIADDRVIAFSSICPHLGCAVDYRRVENDFYCPCHSSKFTLEGEPTNRIPPRPMDSLVTKLVDGRIWLRYETFRGGIAEKVAE